MHSINEFTGDGVTSTYSLSFTGRSPGYLSVDHVKVYYDDVPQDVSLWSLSQPTVVTLNPVPANGTVIKITRETPIIARLVDYSSGAILSEYNLDRSALQLLNLIQELSDRVEVLENA